jgi:hypothetical protein
MMFGSRWWNPYEDPDGKRIWVGGACTATYGGFLDIVVDMTNSSKYTIYVTGGVS